MTEEFDYVAFAKEFEAANGRPPSAKELDDAKWSHYGVKWGTPVYLVSFVFNYIRSAIAVMIMFFVTKVAMFFGR